MHIKREIRIVGIDDGYFDRFRDKTCLIVGAIMRGGIQLDGVLSTKVTVDGWDATDKIIEMLTRTDHFYQLRLIMINGITVAGFNIIDVEKIYEETGLPVIIVIRKEPNFEKIKKALKHFPDFDKRWKVIDSVEKPKKVLTKYGYTYYQKVGISDDDAREIILKTAINSRIPEPVRVAHLIAMGVTKGYSRGKV